MNPKAEMHAAAEAVMAAERERLGGPPTPEEVGAFLQGELPAQEAERIRALLAYYPELTDLLLDPTPPVADDALTDEDLEHDRAALLARAGFSASPPSQPTVTPFRRRISAASTWLSVAAGTTILFLGGQNYQLRHTLREPSILAPRVYLEQANSKRGASQPEKTIYVRQSTPVTLGLQGRPDGDRYHVEIVGGAEKIVSWENVTVRNGELDLIIPAGSLQPGTYIIEVELDGTINRFPAVAK